MLLRHWNLYDSLCNSNYLVSKLQLWKEHGKKELKKILATLGVSLDQAKQKYSFMDPLTRNSFKTKFMESADDLQLGNIAINTFVRQIDNKTQTSAIDMVYAISSILESPKNLSKKDFETFVTTTEEMKRQAETQNMLSSRVSSIHVKGAPG